MYLSFGCRGRRLGQEIPSYHRRLYSPRRSATARGIPPRRILCFGPTGASVDNLVSCLDLLRPRYLPCRCARSRLKGPLAGAAANYTTPGAILCCPGPWLVIQTAAGAGGSGALGNLFGHVVSAGEISPLEFLQLSGIPVHRVRP